MDRCATLSWGPSLENLDLNDFESWSGVGAASTTFLFPKELQVLQMCLGRLFDECGDGAPDMCKVSQEILGWYHINRDRAFAAVDIPSQDIMLGKKMFDSLGHVRASRAKIREEQESLDQRMANADLATQRALSKLGSSGQEHVVVAHAQLLNKLNAWRCQQEEAGEKLVAAAREQAVAAVKQLEVDMEALVAFWHKTHLLQKSAAAGGSEETWNAVMQDIEQEMELLSMGAECAKGNGETGGTDCQKGEVVPQNPASDVIPRMDGQKPASQQLLEAPGVTPRMDEQKPASQQLLEAPGVTPRMDGQKPASQQLLEVPGVTPRMDGQNPNANEQGTLSAVLQRHYFCHNFS